LTEISPEEFRRLHGARSEKFGPVLDEMTVEDARAAGYVLPPGLMTATVARLGSEEEAERFMTERAALQGIDYLGGPAQDQLMAADLGDGALFYHLLLDYEWWEYVWRDGPYVGQVLLVYQGEAPPDIDPVALITRAATAQAERLSSFAESDSAS
jgi:hypothetical protein